MGNARGMQRKCKGYAWGMQEGSKGNAGGQLLQAKWPVQQTVAQLFRQLLRELATRDPETMHKQYETSPGKATKVAKNKKERTRREVYRKKGTRQRKSASERGKGKQLAKTKASSIPNVRPCAGN